MLHRKKLAKDLFLHFDWIGFALYSGGLAVFIFGLNWGGVLYVKPKSFSASVWSLIGVQGPVEVSKCHCDDGRRCCDFVWYPARI
jgi:hypothetical protein